MTTAYTPDHGTQSRYVGARNGSWAPCRCRACTSAHTRACSMRELARLAGTPPLYPAEPLVAHIQTLLDAGMSNDLIGRRANVSSSTISYLVRGLTKACNRDKALRILAVQAGDFDPTALRPVAGTMRRTRAMYFMGHNPKTISMVSGVSLATISHIANGHHQVVQGPIAAAIASAYKILSVRCGTSRKAAARARQLGWYGPLGWDGNIDDPDAEPESDEPEKPLKRDELAAQRRDEVELFHTAGFNDDEIAERVGLHPKTVHEIRYELRTGRKRDRTVKQVAA